MQINGISVRNKKPEDLAALCQGVEGSECLVAFHRPPRRDAYEVGCSPSTVSFCAFISLHVPLPVVMWSKCNHCEGHLVYTIRIVYCIPQKNLDCIL